MDSPEYLSSRAGLNEFEISVLQGTYHSAPKPMNLTLAARGEQFSKVTSLLFACDRRTPAKTINDVMQTYKALENVGFRISMKEVFSMYDGVIASAGAKSFVEDFVKYYRNHPDFLYGSIDDRRTQIKALQAIDRICEKGVDERNFAVVKECLDGAFEARIINEENYNNKRKKALERGIASGVLKYDNAESGISAEEYIGSIENVNDFFDPIAKSAAGENFTASKPPMKGLALYLSPLVAPSSVRSRSSTATSLDGFELAAASRTTEIAATSRDRVGGGLSLEVGKTEVSVPSGIVMSPVQMARQLQTQSETFGIGLGLSGK